MEKREKSHWFLKHPMVPAFVLPLGAIIGVTILTSLILKVVVAVCGDGVRSFTQAPEFVTSLLRIALGCIIILVMRVTSEGRFSFGMTGKRFAPGFVLASAGLIIAVLNVIEGFFINSLPLQSTLIGWIVALVGGFAPGFFEEIVCRGVVLGNMMQRWRGKGNYVLVSVLASGIAFGLVHFFNLLNGDVFGTLQQVLYASAIGIFFGAVYVRTRNLWATIAVHAIIDFCALMFVGQFDTSTMFSMASAAFTIVAFTVLGLYLVRPSKIPEIRELWENPEQD